MRILLMMTFSICTISVLQGQIRNLDQYVIASAGEVISSSQYSIDFTIGEPIDIVLQNEKYLLIQGYQQPELPKTTSVVDQSFRNLVQVFPNPTSDNIQVRFNGNLPNNPTIIAMYDSSGRKLKLIELIGELRGESISIDLKPFPVGHYILHVSDRTEIQFATFKIIKTR